MPQITKQLSITSTPQTLLSLLRSAGYKALPLPCKLMLYNKTADVIYLNLNQTPNTAPATPDVDGMPLLAGAPSGIFTYDRNIDSEAVDISSLWLSAPVATTVQVMIIGG